MSAEDSYIRQSAGQASLWKGKAPLLDHLEIELTERCNNSCLHCYINRPENDRDAELHELNTEQWKGILSQAAELGALSVCFTGGEPLLREDFVELYTFTRRLGLRVQLFTNARRITRELAGLFARIPPLQKIEITVYGMHEQSYNAVACNSAAFGEFQQGIHNLQDFNVPFMVKGALLPANKEEIDEFEAWAKSLPGGNEPLGYAMFFYLRGRRDSFSRNRVIQNLRVHPSEGVRILARQEEHYREEMRQFCSRFLGAKGDVLFNCGAGKSVCIDAYGFSQPCIVLRDPAFAYDLRTVSLRDIITRFYPHLKTYRAGNPEYLERCARCFLRNLCSQCPGKSWSENGTLDTPIEYYCQVAHAQACFLGLLQPGEKAWEVLDWQTRLAQMLNGDEQ